MHALSRDARLVLDRMEPDRRYEVTELRALAPHASAERLAEILHELWIDRQVERVGPSGSRRHRSAPDHQRGAVPARPAAVVKPEDLFDHDTFQDFFK